MTRALITGISGQDGSYLAEFLLKRGYEVFGTVSHHSPIGLGSRIDHLMNKIDIEKADLTNENIWIKVIDKIRPDEIYNLGAISFAGTSFNDPLHVLDVTGLGVVRILEAIRRVNPKIRMYQASSSEMFGRPDKCPQNEDTPLNPVSPYGIAKVLGYNMTKLYRKAYGIFAVNGILFNHESPRRGIEFVTRKITRSVAAIKLGLQNELRFGNIDAQKDWGYAGDFIESMWLMMQHQEPDDWVIGTGKTHTVREFLEHAFNKVGLNWDEYTKIDQSLYRPIDTVNFM